MSDIRVNEYVSGGYYLTRLGKRERCMSPDLIPDHLLSASTVICGCFPASWTVSWWPDDQGERLQRPSAFGISQDDLPRVIEWATDSLNTEFGWPSAFYTLDGARGARERFIPPDLDVLIIG